MRQKQSAVLLSVFSVVFLSGLFFPLTASSARPLKVTGDCSGLFSILRSGASPADKITAADKTIKKNCQGRAAVLRNAYRTASDLRLKLVLLSDIGLSGDIEYSKKILSLAEERPEDGEVNAADDDAAAADLERRKLLDEAIKAELLVKFLGDRDASIRKRAVALLRVLNEVSGKDEAGTALFDVLSSSANPGRAEAAGLLAESRNRVYGHALGCLVKYDRDPVIKLIAIKGICRMRLEDCRGAVMAAVDDPDEGLRNGVYAALSDGELSVNDEDYAVLAEKPFSSKYPEISAKAIRLKYAARAPESAAEVQAFLRDQHEAVRKAAYEMLARSQKGEVCSAFVDALGDSDNDVKQIALAEVRKRNCAAAFEPLKKLLAAGSISDRQRLLPVMGAIGGKKGLEEVKKYSGTRELKVPVAGVCEQAGDKKCALRLYAECLDDGDTLRDGAAGLARLKSAAAEEALLKNLRAAGLSAELPVIGALGETGGKRAADELWALYNKADTYDLRVNVLLALVRLKDGRAAAPALALLEGPGAKGDVEMGIAAALAASGDRRVLDALGNFISKNAVDGQAYFINPVTQGETLIGIFSGFHDNAHLGAIIDLSRGIMNADGGYCDCKDWDDSCISECEEKKAGPLRAAAGYFAAAADPKAMDVLPEMLRESAWHAEGQVFAAMKACGGGKLFTSIAAQYKLCDSPVCKMGLISAASELAGAAQVRFLTDVYSNETDNEVKAQAAEVMASAAYKRLPEALSAEIRSQDAAVRAEAAWAIGALSSPLPKPGPFRADVIGYTYFMVAMSISYTRMGFDLITVPAKPAVAALIPELIAALRDENEKVRSNAAESLGAFYDVRAAGALASALRDDNPEIRERAAAAMHGTYGSTAAAALAGALKDPSARVRKAAAERLGEFTAADSGPALIEALDDQDPGVVSAALTSLGNIREERAVKAVILKAMPGSKLQDEAIAVLGRIGGEAAADFLADMDSTDPKRLVQALAALGNIKDYPVGRQLLRFRSSRNKNVRAQVLDSLAGISVSENIGEIIAFTGDKNAEIRLKAVSDLGMADGAAAKKAAAARLTGLLKSGSAELRAAALDSLARLKDPSAAAPVIEALKKGRVPAASAVDALGEIGEPEAFDPITTTDGVSNAVIVRAVGKLRARDEKACQVTAACLYMADMDARLEAVKAMGTACRHKVLRGDTFVMPMIIEKLLYPLLNDENADISDEAALSLGQLGDAKALPYLSRLIREAGGFKRIKAMEAISGISGDVSVKLLADQITGEDLVISMQAVNLIAGMPGPESASALLEALRKGDRNARLLIMPKLGELKYKPAFDTLLYHLGKGDSYERAAAAYALGAAGESSFLEPLKKAALDKDERVRHAAAEAIVAIERPGV